MIDISLEILQILWANLEERLGHEATALVFQSALREAIPANPILEHTKFEGDRPVAFSLNAETSGENLEHIRKGFVSYLNSIFGILTDLIGSVLADPIKIDLHHYETLINRLEP